MLPVIEVVGVNINVRLSGLIFESLDTFLMISFGGSESTSRMATVFVFLSL